jgi:hypothetical protein
MDTEQSPFLSWERVKRRFAPEGKILVYSLFAGLAAGPALAFGMFTLAGTVPVGYTLTRFYSDVRIDLMRGVWMAWAVVLAPYALVQLFRIARWAVRALKASVLIS